MDPSTGASAATFPSDPLEALGPSLFLSVLALLPYHSLALVPSVCRAWRYHSRCHRTGIWLAACRRSGVDPELIAELEKTDNTPNRTRKTPSGPIETEYTDWTPYRQYLPSDVDAMAGRKPGEVDWKRVCQVHILEDKNWRFGRCREKWVYPDEDTMATWRFKIDESDDTCIISSFEGGLTVVDMSTSDSLFEMPYVQGFAHVEFCKGFVVFNVEGPELGLQVYRTRQAVSGSAHPWPKARRLPREALQATSTHHPDWRPLDHILPQIGQPPKEVPPALPRGALAFYRSIAPPTPCFAFRAREDHAGTENARAVLGTAGEQAVYIWDLDATDLPAETISIPASLRGIMVQYLEFDDNYIFLCGRSQLVIFSRQTKQLIFAFPPQPTTVRQLCTAAYRVELSDTAPLPRPSDVDIRMKPETFDGRSAVVGRVDVVGYRSHEEDILDALCMDLLEPLMAIEGEDGKLDWSWSSPDYRFSACHFTPTDLVYSSELGHLVITRDYATILAITDPLVRAKAWCERTIIIGARLDIKQLAVDGTHVTANTNTHIFFFDTRTLPDLPLAAGQALPPIRIHSILSAHPSAVGHSSCAQLHRSTIYYTYLATMDTSEDDPIPVPRYLSNVPNRAKEGFASCHYSETDLICTSKIGQIFVIRDYASVLTIPDPTLRLEQWAKQTIIINLDIPIRHLATNTSGQIVATTTKHVVFFDAATLPPLPLASGDPIPPIRLHSILDVDPVAIGDTPCLQIGSNKIHVGYRVIPDVPGIDAYGQQVVYGPDAPYVTLHGASFGYCIKEWDFGPASAL